MTYDEFRRQVGKAGISARKFAELVKMTPNSITNYASQGEVPAHLAIIIVLMAEMADNGLNFQDVVSKIDITPHKVRGSAAKGHFGGSKQMNLDLKGN